MAELAERELAAIPERFTRHLADVGIMVEERTDDTTLARMAIRSPWHLLGLDRGRSALRRSFRDRARFRDTFLRFRQALLLW